MMRHLNPEPVAPARVVVLGGSGFLGRRLLGLLDEQGVGTLGLSSADLDLTAPGAGERLAGLLQPDDVLVFASCLTPDKGKDVRTAMRNLAMGEQVAAALMPGRCAQVVYVSSDAVYADDESLVRETSRCEPSTLYGLAHLTRERMVRLAADAARIPWLVVRPTLLYGQGDTHNSYGPNRFVRQARETGVIKLFGNGEEKRDHVCVADAARLLLLCVQRRSTGVVNLASGASPSFRDVAEACIAADPQPARLECSPRGGPITYRHFDVSVLARAFPLFRFTPLEEGLRQEYFAPAAGEDRVTSVVLLREDGAALLQHRDDKPGLSCAGLWVMPGGHFEPGEDSGQCARRELEEETGYQAADLRYLAALPHVNDITAKPYQLVFYWGRYDGRQAVECREGQALRFVRRGEADALAIPEVVLRAWDLALALTAARKAG
jgi:nucleoside-diphosphate-sugar epimerase/8-oxo-dGTP pyrophosphatase MutT (NUDIX family)